MEMAVFRAGLGVAHARVKLRLAAFEQSFKSEKAKEWKEKLTAHEIVADSVNFFYSRLRVSASCSSN